MQATPLRATLALLAFSTLVTSISCRAPHRDYDTEQINALDDLEQLMDVQATVADPRFDLADELKDRDFTAEDWAAFLDMGTRLQATAAKVASFSEGEDFDRWNTQLGNQARDLVTHIQAKAAPQTLATVHELQATCRACHDKYK